MCLLRLDPGAGAEDLIEVQGHVPLLNQALDLLPVGLGKDPHQGLGGEPVLGSLLVVTLGHVIEHQMSCLVNVMDDLAKIALEVLGSQSLKVRQSCRGDIPLPLEVALASFNVFPHPGILIHEGLEGSGDLELLGRDGTLA